MVTCGKLCYGRIGDPFSDAVCLEPPPVYFVEMKAVNCFGLTKEVARVNYRLSTAMYYRTRLCRPRKSRVNNSCSIR